MNIKAAQSATTTLAYVQDMKARQAAKIAAEARKAEVAKSAAAALTSPRLSGAEASKQQAKARLQQVGERLKILKQLYANDPRQMARALAQAFKELKDAVKAYKAAGGQEMGMSNDLAASAVQAGAPRPAEAEAKADTAEAEADRAEPVPETDAIAAQHGASIYSAVATEVRERIGEDGLDFAKLVRGMANKISELLETARTQARARKPDKDTDEAVEEADKTLADLRDELASLESDIRMAAPGAGMKLEAAA